MSDSKRRPVARITAKLKDGGKHQGIIAIWENDKYEGLYNVTFGDRDTDMEEIIEMVESGDYWFNFFWNKDD